VEVATDLIQVNQKLGLATDAGVIFERTNAALRSRGFSEMPGHLMHTEERGTRPNRASPPQKTDHDFESQPAESGLPALARAVG